MAPSDFLSTPAWSTCRFRRCCTTLKIPGWFQTEKVRVETWWIVGHFWSWRDLLRSKETAPNGHMSFNVWKKQNHLWCKMIQIEWFWRGSRPNRFFTTTVWLLKNGPPWLRWWFAPPAAVADHNRQSLAGDPGQQRGSFGRLLQDFKDCRSLLQYNFYIKLWVNSDHIPFFGLMFFLKRQVFGCPVAAECLDPCRRHGTSSPWQGSTTSARPATAEVSTPGHTRIHSTSHYWYQFQDIFGLPSWHTPFSTDKIFAL